MIFLSNSEKSRIFAKNMEVMKTNNDTKKVSVAFMQKMLNDKNAITKCIREGGNINNVAAERRIKLVKPL